MPFYEYQCARCGARAEVFVRTVNTVATAPKCPDAGRQKGHEMTRIVSPFIRHMTGGSMTGADTPPSPPPTV
jgi:putative FmdB family regulatory protein